MDIDDGRVRPYFQLRLRGDERAFPDLLDVSAFLLDLTTLYEVIRLGVAKPEYEFTRFTLYRNSHRVPEREKLFLESLRHESPLDLQAIFLATGAGASALWILIQTFEKIWNIRLNRRKLVAEVERAERETARARSEQAAAEARRAIERRDREQVVERLEKRLESSAVRIREADVSVIHRDVPPEDEPAPKK